METKVLPDWLYQHRNSCVLAIEFDGEVWTYQQLFGRATVLAGQLRKRGVNSGDRVALMARHGLVFGAALHALMQVNAILVPINTRLSVREIHWQLEDAGVSVLITDTEFAGMAKQIIGEWSGENSPIVYELDGVNWGDPEEPVFREHVQLDQVHAIVYTSGTTGKPKGAMITYGNHFWGAVGSALRLGLDKRDLWLIPLPLFHVGGLAVLLRSLIYGTSVLIHTQFDPHKVMADIKTRHVTLISVVAVMLQRMLAVLDEREEFPDTVRAVLLGGGPAPQTLFSECVKRHVPVQFSYGLTESNSQAATVSLTDSLRKLGSAGQALFMNEIRIAGQDHEGKGPGEILLRGPTVVKGYYHKPTETAKTFIDGWLYTGDIGYLDEEGYLYVLDRRQDLIISGGENVYPAEIETVLHEFPGVVEVGVAGMPDEVYGQVPFAVIRTDGHTNVSEAELRQFCAARLARYKVPSVFRFADELPRNAAGKLLRRELLRWL